MDAKRLCLAFVFVDWQHSCMQPRGLGGRQIRLQSAMCNSCTGLCWMRSAAWSTGSLSDTWSTWSTRVQGFQIFWLRWTASWMKRTCFWSCKHLCTRDRGRQWPKLCCCQLWLLRMASQMVAGRLIIWPWEKRPGSHCLAVPLSRCCQPPSKGALAGREGFWHRKRWTPLCSGSLKMVALMWAAGLSTHSCKATCISWCAKHDVSPEHREILARHSKASQGPTALYSRDLITAALRSLVSVIEAIKKQHFFLDRSRSGMITPVPAPGVPLAATPLPSTPLPTAVPEQTCEVAGAVEHEVASVVPSPESPLMESPGSWNRVEWPEQELQDDAPQAPEPPNLLEDWQANSSDSSYGSDSDSDVEVTWDRGSSAGASSQAPACACVKWFINGKTLVIHERRNETLFKCGRVIGDSYFPIARLTGQRCGKCFADVLWCSGCPTVKKFAQAACCRLETAWAVMIMLVCPAHVVQLQMFVHVGCEFVFCETQFKSLESLICVTCHMFAPRFNAKPCHGRELTDWQVVFVSSLVQMAGLVDSEAHFEARANEYGVPPAFLQALRREGITTVGHLAFAVFRPGAEFNEREFDNWAQGVNNNVPLTMGAAAAVRRLHYECEVIMTSTIRSTVETPDSSTPKAIPFAEKTARMDQIKLRLQGLNIAGTGEPSHALLDECAHQFETRVLKYLEPAKCTSRENEITAGRTDKKLKLDAGSLSIKESKTMPDETVSTTYNLATCLRRRGIAYDFANLISFRAHELYVERLLRHLSLEPPPA